MIDKKTPQFAIWCNDIEKNDAQRKDAQQSYTLQNNDKGLHFT